MTIERVAEMTVEELKGLIAAVVDERLSAMKASRLQEIAGLLESSAKRREYQETSVLPKRTKEEQGEINQALIDWYREWAEEGDEEEQRETLQYLQKALDEDRLSNRPLFPQK